MTDLEKLVAKALSDVDQVKIIHYPLHKVLRNGRLTLIYVDVMTPCNVKFDGVCLGTVPTMHGSAVWEFFAAKARKETERSKTLLSEAMKVFGVE